MYNKKTNSFARSNDNQKTYEEYKPYSCGDKVKSSEAYQVISKSGEWYRLMLHLTFESGKTYEQCIALSQKQFAGVELMEN